MYHLRKGILPSGPPPPAGHRLRQLLQPSDLHLIGTRFVVAFAHQVGDVGTLHRYWVVQIFSMARGRIYLDTVREVSREVLHQIGMLILEVRP